MATQANAPEQDLSAVVRTAHRRILHTIARWRRRELWIITAAAVTLAVGIVWSYQRWDVTNADRTQAAGVVMQARSGTCKTLPAAECDSLGGVVSETLQGMVADRRAFLSTRSWLRPLALGFALVAIPLFLLVLHWDWARVKQNELPPGAFPHDSVT